MILLILFIDIGFLIPKQLLFDRKQRETHYIIQTHIKIIEINT
jgi:hypothetical protein